MNILKRIIIALLLFIAMLVLGVTGAYLLVDNATMVAMATKQLGRASSTQITYRKDAAITRTLTPTLSLNELLIQDNKQNFQVSISTLELKISLPGLLFGRLDIARLKLGDTRVEIKGNGMPGKLQMPESLPLRPVLHDVSISQISIDSGDNKFALPPMHISRLNLSPELISEKFVCTVQTEFGGQKIISRVELSGIDNIMKSRVVSFSIAAEGAGVGLSLKGQVDFNPPVPTVAASVNGKGSDLRGIYRGANDFDLPGEFILQSNVRGPIDQIAMEDFSVTWKVPGESTVTLSGRIADINELTGFDLAVDGQFDKPTWFGAILPGSIGTINNGELSARIEGTWKHPGIRTFALKMDTMDGLDLSLNGQLDMLHTPSGMKAADIDLHLAFTAPTTRAARSLLFEEVWEFGPITGKADIRSSGDGDPAFENIEVQTRAENGIEVEVTGGITQLPIMKDAPVTGFDLDVNMKALQTSIMGETLGVHLPLEGPLDISYKITGDSVALQLNEIELSAGKKNAVQLDVKGQVLYGDLTQSDPLQSIDLHIQAISHDTHSVGAAIEQQLPELGAINAQARLHTVSGKHRIDDLHIQAGESSGLQIAFMGSAEHLTFFPEVGIEGIQLTASATADDTAQVNDVIDLPKDIPAMGPLQGSAQITGSDQKLTVNDVLISAGQKDILLIQAEGQLGIFSAENAWYPQDTDIMITALSDSSRAFAEVLGYHIPDLGPITGNASLQDKGKTIGLGISHFLVGESSTPAVTASGYINDLFAAGESKLTVKINLDGHTFAAFADTKKLEDLGALLGDLVISNSDGSLGIDSFLVKSSNAKLLSMEINGQFDDFKKPETLSLSARLTARDLQLVGSLFDREWPAIGPVTLDSQVMRKGKSIGFDTTMTAGETRLQSSISTFFDANPPHISGKIKAQNFFFPDFLEKTKKSGKEESSTESLVFSRTPMDFNWLKKANLDLSVAIESFDKERSQLESAQFEITLESGHLVISPASLVYPKGTLELDMKLDVQDQPQISFKMFGRDINPWLALDMKQPNTDSGFDAEMNVDMEFMSSGASAHELAANLEGDVYVIINNGRIRKEMLTVVFVDVIGWTFNKATGAKYAEVECGVADYTIKQGIINTNGFFIDTPDIAIAGEGSIDLANETIDYVFLPRKKSRLIGRAEPVNVNGSLNDPSIKVIPLKSALTNYGTLFFSPYLFAGILATGFMSNTLQGSDSKSPCKDYEKKHEQDKEMADQNSKPEP